MTTPTSNAPITEYERAVCYYTLPRVVSPATIGLMAAYAVCLLEAVAALAFGLIRNNPTWTKWGTIALAAIIVLGVVAFVARAFLNEVRTRRLLVSAEAVPDPTSGFDDLPDPFANHLLLRFQPFHQGDTVTVQDDSGRERYSISKTGGAKLLSVRSVDTGAEFTVALKRRGASFRLNPNSHFGPNSAGAGVVQNADGLLATIRQRFSLMGPRCEILTAIPARQTYSVRGGAIYSGNSDLIGRIYQLRQYKYLDIENARLNPGILSYFLFFS